MWIRPSISKESFLQNWNCKSLNTGCRFTCIIFVLCILIMNTILHHSYYQWICPWPNASNVKEIKKDYEINIHIINHVKYIDDPRICEIIEEIVKTQHISMKCYFIIHFHNFTRYHIYFIIETFISKCPFVKVCGNFFPVPLCMTNLFHRSGTIHCPSPFSQSQTSCLWAPGLWANGKRQSFGSPDVRCITSFSPTKV